MNLLLNSDSIVEDTETVLLTVSSADSPTTATTTLNILDDDGGWAWLFYSIFCFLLIDPIMVARLELDIGLAFVERFFLLRPGCLAFLIPGPLSQGWLLRGALLYIPQSVQFFAFRCDCTTGLDPVDCS